MPTAPALMTATQARAAIQSRTLSSEELVSACLAQIAARDQDLGAWVQIDADGALAQARECDRQAVGGPLHGIPVGIKDVLSTRDFPTRCQSAIYAQSLPLNDAYCVAAIRRAGGIILGKTTTSEFAYITPAATRNPHNPQHTPGGSSSGSAAAVAAHMVPLSIATQTGGSTIRPAAYCGIVGYKPTFGMINRSGLKMLAESLDTIGLMARCVRDVALLGGVLGYRPLIAPPDHPARMPRLGLCSAFLASHADVHARENLTCVAQLLAKAGAHVDMIDLPPMFERLVEDQALIMEYEAARSLLTEQGDNINLLSPALLERLNRGWNHSWDSYDMARQRAMLCRGVLSTAMSHYDALLTYSACGQAPRSLAHAGDSIMNRAWTLLGTPCVALPSAISENGLPIGIQVIGKHEQDQALLNVAYWIEYAMGRE